MPTTELDPGLRFELGLGVGGDDADRIGPGVHAPFDDPGDQRRLANAVAGGGGFLDYLVRRGKAIADAGQLLALPRFGAGKVLESGVGHAPRERAEDIGEWVVGDGTQPVDEIVAWGDRSVQKAPMTAIPPAVVVACVSCIEPRSFPLRS